MMFKVAKLGIAIAAIVALIVPAAFAGVPDNTKSFYVPEATIAGPTVVDGIGTPPSPLSSPNNAIFYLKTCPNNHGGGPTTVSGFLTNDARIRIVVHDQQDNPISGIAAADICVLLNGGTVAQGFSGAGADSTIANNALPTTNGTGGFPLCPNVRCIQADAPTDATGTTYVTFTGSTPGSPGVGTRDANRKWGHADGPMPVFVLGFPISGRLSQGSANGSFVLAIRNVDHAGGLTTSPTDIAEAVNPADFNAQVAGAGPPYNFLRDFDGDGSNSVTGGQLNPINGHQGHNCAVPTP